MKKMYHPPKRGIITLCAIILACTNYYVSATEVTTLLNNNVIAQKSEIGKNQTVKVKLQEIITGTVVDETGTPLPGANIIEKGTNNGVQTDFDGNFNIKLSGKSSILVISYLGYSTQEIDSNEQTNIIVTLEPSTSELDEVVVIGYGSQKKSDLTGSVAVIDTEIIERRVSINPLSNLQGNVAGLNVTNNSGRPGGNFSVTIRGKGSINASNEPLYVIDGIIGVDIALINPNDIEYISVLKDASATAIYGSRGANGVILVTTKKGKSGKITVDFNSNLQISRPTHIPEMLNSMEYWKDLKVRLDEDRRAMGAPAGAFVADYPATYPEFFTDDGTQYGMPIYNTNWFDESSRTAFSQQYFLNVRGGGENYNLSLSAGTQDDEGILLNTYTEKNTMRINGEMQINNWLKVGGNLSYSSSKANIVDDYRLNADNLTLSPLVYLPIYPTQYEDGTAVNADDLKNDGGGWDIWYGATPKDRLNLLNRINYKRQVTRNLFAEIDFTNNLKFKSSYSILDYNTEFRSHIAKRIDTFRNRSTAELSNSNSSQTLFENTITYNNTFFEDHSLVAVIGTARQENEAFSSGLTSQDFDDFFVFYNVGQGTAVPIVSSNFSKYITDSYFGRINYSYKDKYLITATGRYDGSSRFGKNNKYSFFPSTALAWRISNEPFMKDLSSISNLKLRGSFGVTGNDGIGNYDKISRPGAQSAIFNGVRESGSSQGTIGNDDLKWERTEEFNVGLDIGLFNRIEVIADYYTRTTKDLLFNVPIARFTGYSSIVANAGSMRNRGIELLINSTNVKTTNFTWGSSINFTKNDMKILSLGTQDKDIFTRPIFPFNQQVFRVGETPGAFWGYNRLGTWGTDEVTEAARYGRIPGDIKLEDKNNDGLLNFNDQQIIGKGLPDYTMNIGNTFSYKNWDLSVDIRISQGNDILDHSVLLYVDRMGYNNTYKKFFEMAWTPENQNTMYPRVRKDIRKFDGNDTGHVFDGSFIRGQNLNLSYNFESSFLEKIKLQAAKVYLNLQNFFLITDYHGYDPEVSSFFNDSSVGNRFTEGIEYMAYPKAMTVNFGFLITL